MKYISVCAYLAPFTYAHKLSAAPNFANVDNAYTHGSNYEADNTANLSNDPWEMKVYQRYGLPDRHDVIRATDNINHGNPEYPMYGVMPLDDLYRFHPLPIEKGDPKWYQLGQNIAAYK